MKSTFLKWFLLLALCSATASAGNDGEALVIIKDFEFIPQEIHSVWFEALGESEPEDYLFPEDSYARSFDKPGVYPYRCGPHPEMTGTVTVAE
jgi:hypothetical protein